MLGGRMASRIGISQNLPAVSIIKKGDNEPYKKSCRHRYCHNHISYFISQVHKDRDDIKSLGQCEYANNPFKNQYQELVGIRTFMDGINTQAQAKFGNSKHQ